MKKVLLPIVSFLLAFMLIGSAVAEPVDLEIDSEDVELDVVAEEVDEAVLEVEDLFLGEDEPIEVVGDLGLVSYSEEPAMSNGEVLANSDDDFIIEDGILTSYLGSGGNIDIPNGVLAIANTAFASSNLTEPSTINIPASVKKIADDAFHEYASGYSYKNIIYIIVNGSNPYFCSDNGVLFNKSKSELIRCPGGYSGGYSIPTSTDSILFGAFQDCPYLTEITIPNTVTSIEGDAFAHCSALKEATIPSSVERMGTDIFFDCDALKNVTINAFIKDIGAGIFQSSDNLETVAIPDSVETLDYTFYNCTNFTSIKLPKALKTIGTCAFANCKFLKEIHIPEGVEYIGESSFSNCVKLLDIWIPHTVNYIDSDAFGNCLLLSIHCIKGTYADKWAQEHGFEIEYYPCPHYPIIEEGKPATCTETGLTEGKHCSVCGEILTKQDVIPAKGHKAVTDRAVPATCTKTGLTKGSHCSVCGEILTEQDVIPAKGHKTVTDPAVAPTTSKTGLTEGSHCSVCGKVLVKQKTVPKLISIKKCTITGIKDAVYTGKAIAPAPVVKYNGKKLVKGRDYTVKYANNKAVGTATVTITGIGKYGESVKKTFKINPRPVALSSLTAGSKQLTVKWNKGKNITGYEVQYSLKSSFKSAKKVTISKTSTVKTILKSLKANKTYYVRIRTYKTVKGKKYYSTWSKAKSAKPTK